MDLNQINMLLISHRGNISGPNPKKENQPSYINKAIDAGYDVEVDVWVKDDQLYLGHDEPQYPVHMNWIRQRDWKLWLHCKNLEAVQYLIKEGTTFLHWFWHEEDKLTITSQGFIWVYPGVQLEQPIAHSVAVLPEVHNDPVEHCECICSDYIENYLEFT